MLSFWIRIFGLNHQNIHTLISPHLISGHQMPKAMPSFLLQHLNWNAYILDLQPLSISSFSVHIVQLGQNRIQMYIDQRTAFLTISQWYIFKCEYSLSCSSLRRRQVSGYKYVTDRCTLYIRGLIQECQYSIKNMSHIKGEAHTHTHTTTKNQLRNSTMDNTKNYYYLSYSQNFANAASL